MYDKSLEQLIDAVIADGIITDQERKVVYKKAKALGIDQDEIEVYLNGRLDAFKHTNKPTSNKHGDVRLCPNCGATVPSFATRCKECGYEFRGTEAVRSMSDLFAKLNATNEIDKKCEILRTFPIPNNQEDLLEFISASESNSEEALGILGTRENHWITGFLVALSVFVLLFFVLKGEGETFSEALGWALFVGCLPAGLCFFLFGLMGKPNKIAKAWEVKLNTALNKVNVASKNDPNIKVQADNITAKYCKKKKTTKAVFLGWFLLLVIICVIAANMPATALQERAEREKIEDLKHQKEVQFRDSIDCAISGGKYEEADKLIKSRYIDENEYFKFLQKCVEDMGEKRKFKDARAFIKRKTVFFNTEYDTEGWRKEYKREIVIEKLNTIIDSYQ